MIKIRNESDLHNWFKKNYKKLGFTKIIQFDRGDFPDFIMQKGNSIYRVELEIFSSNFIQHRHDPKKVDLVICAYNNIKLNIPVKVIKNVKLIEFDKKTPLSFENQIYKLFKKDKILTTNEVAKLLNIHQATADSYLKDMVIDGEIERIKKEGVTLWLKK